MATPTCTFCEQYSGLLMATNLLDGDTVVVCPNDMMSYALGLASMATEGMTIEQATAYAEALDAIYDHDPRRGRVTKAKERAKTRQRPPAELPPDGPEGDAAAPVALVPPCEQCGGTTATGDALKLVCNECGNVIATADSQPPGGNDDMA